MAVVTWDGSSSTAYSTAANWDTGSVPVDGDDVIIPDTSGGSINACNVDSNDSCNSLTVLANGEIGSNAGAKLFILGEADGTGATTNGFAVNIDGTITDNGGTSLDLDIRTPAATTIDLYAQGGGKLRNVVFNHASCVATLGALLDITGDLTMSAGELNTNSGSNYAVTVAGHVSVTGTLTGNASAISAGSMIINSGGTYSATTGTTTINSEEASHAFRCSGGGTFTDNNGTLLITTPAETRLKMNGTGNVHHLTVNHASCTLFMESDSSTTIEGNLTITAGTVRPHTQGNSQRTLIVTGNTRIGPASGGPDQATLSCSDSPMSLGSGKTDDYGLTVVKGGTFVGGTGTHTIGSLAMADFDDAKCTLTSGVTTMNGEDSGDNYTINIGGSSTFAHGNGTVTFTIGDTTRIRTNTKPLYNVIVNNANASIEYVGDQTIDNDLTVTAGKFRYNSFEDLTVTGDVSVTGILGHPNVGTTSDSTFGSLTINSGGEYKAPSGTTTITAETASHAWYNTGGTFTHNNGKVKIFDATGTVMGSTSVRENTFYDLEISLHVATYTCSLYDVSGNAVTILNNLDLTKGEVEFSTASDTITIHGLTNITADAKFCDNAGHDTNKIIHNGLVTNLGTYNINDGTTVKLNGGIRQLGTLTVK